MSCLASDAFKPYFVIRKLASQDSCSLTNSCRSILDASDIFLPFLRGCDFVVFSLHDEAKHFRVVFYSDVILQGLELLSHLPFQSQSYLNFFFHGVTLPFLIEVSVFYKRCIIYLFLAHGVTSSAIVYQFHFQITASFSPDELNFESFREAVLYRKMIIYSREPELSKDPEYDLKKSTEFIGPLYPILEAKDGDVLDGVHRFKADHDWPRLKLDHIDSEEKKIAARLVANFHRRQVSGPEKASRLKDPGIRLRALTRLLKE